jgi:hypothetical protein
MLFILVVPFSWFFPTGDAIPFLKGKTQEHLPLSKTISSAAKKAEELAIGRFCALK